MMPAEVPDPETLVGLVIDGRYRVEEEIGRGSMGVVYRAKHIALNRYVAIKVIHQRLMTTPNAVDRFQREAHLAAKLSHKNLVGVLDVSVLEDGRHTMVLEYATGKTLADWSSLGRMSPARVVRLLRQICDGLEVAHRTGLVHRDLKPENIVIEHDLGGNEVPRIIDFGIAISRGQSATARLTAAGIALGTPSYMSPEQAVGEELDQRCDLFALGVVAYELLAGVTPFDCTGVEVIRANLRKRVPSFATRVPGLVIDPGLETIVMNLLAKRREDRYPSAHDVREALDRLDGSSRLYGESIDRPLAPRTRTRRRRSSLMRLVRDD